MRTISLESLLHQVSARKVALGMTDTPTEVEAMRNKGGKRTHQKRELLRRMQKRAQAAGLEPVKAHF